MRRTILTVAAAIAISASAVAPGLTAAKGGGSPGGHQQTQQRNGYENCTNVQADRDAYSQSEVRACGG